MTVVDGFLRDFVGKQFDPPAVPATTVAGDPVTYSGLTSSACVPVDQVVAVTGCGATPNRSAGKAFTVAASAYSAALEPEPGTTARTQALNGARTPLAAFTGVDLTKAETITLGFGDSGLPGSVQFTDVALREPATTIDPTDPAGGRGGSGATGAAGGSGASGTTGAAGAPLPSGAPGTGGADGTSEVSGSNSTRKTITGRSILLRGTSHDRRRRSKRAGALATPRTVFIPPRLRLPPAPRPAAAAASRGR